MGLDTFFAKEWEAGIPERDFSKRPASADGFCCENVLLLRLVAGLPAFVCSNQSVGGV
jgi:hypothetical protein